MNVIICGVVKNAAANLQENIERAIQVGERCDKYKIAIYENNSTDATKAILERYLAHPNFHIRMEDLDSDDIKRESKIWAYTAVTGSDHPCRMEQIANARNKLVSEFTDATFDDYSYVVMIDMDSKFYSVDGILTSLEMVKANRRRVIYANSLNYYDYYALRSSHSEFNLFGPELTGENFWQQMNTIPLRINPESPNLVSVYSAFNGIGVFDKNIFKNHRYDALVTQGAKDMYTKIALENSAIYSRLKNIIQGECLKFPGGECDDDGLYFWKNNSGYDKPVICEHVPFNFSLLNDRYELYINPSMLYWWS
jgi:hypothetical protein